MKEYLTKVMDRIDDAKKREAIHEMSVIAYELVNKLAQSNAQQTHGKINFALLREICLHNSCVCHCIGAPNDMACNEQGCPVVAKLTSPC